MTTYTVHDRPVREDQEPDFVLVKEGFNWWSLLFPLLWLLARRQWLALLVYLAATAAIAVVLQVTGVDPLTQGLIWLVFALFVAATANDWRRWRLDDAGYRLVDVVEGRNLDDAEERWLRRQPVTPRTTARSSYAGSETAMRAPRAGLKPFATPFDPV